MVGLWDEGVVGLWFVGLWFVGWLTGGCKVFNGDHHINYSDVEPVLFPHSGEYHKSRIFKIINLNKY